MVVLNCCDINIVREGLGPNKVFSVMVTVVIYDQWFERLLHTFLGLSVRLGFFGFLIITELFIFLSFFFLKVPKVLFHVQSTLINPRRSRFYLVNQFRKIVTGFALRQRPVSRISRVNNWCCILNPNGTLLLTHFIDLRCAICSS